MKTLVTGDRGFLGRHLCPALERAGHELYWSNTTCNNLSKVENLYKFNHIGFDYIIHLAAVTKAGDYCLRHKGDQWIENQTINTNILRYWKEQQYRATMVTFGTSCAYSPYFPLSEDYYMMGETDVDLRTYALTKRMLLNGLQSLNEQYGLNYIYFIPSTLYGPLADKGDSHFIFDLVRKIKAGAEFGHPVILWGDGHQTRELIHVKDCVNIILSLLGEKNLILNLGTGEPYSIREYAEIICRYYGYNPDKIIYDTSKYTGVTNKTLRIDRLRSYGFELTPFKQGIHDIL